MRLPNYLFLAPSGVWHYRQRIPGAIARRMGRTFIKRSLATCDPKTAQLRALTLSTRYAQIFEAVRAMPDKTDVQKLIRSAKQGKDFTLEVGPDGFKLTTDGSEGDNEAGQKALTSALERIGDMRFMSPPYLGEPAPKAPAGPSVGIGKAVALWLAEIKTTTKTKTLSIKATAVDGFAKHYGEQSPLADVGRLDVGKWVQALRASNLATPTLVNKLSYLRGFLTWAKARGYIPAFPDGENPAIGQVVYGASEKRARRALGFKPFTTAQIQALFAPSQVAELSEGARWASLIGLYTGARASEVGQLALSDFSMVDGLPCITITDEGDDQSLKTEASERVIPIHPHLIQLGLWEHVQALRKNGAKRLFTRAKSNAVNGAGNWISKAFSYHLKERLKIKKPAKGKIGFHSLRKTVIQTMQDNKTPPELRVAFVGHELEDEHFMAYSRKPTPRELLDEIQKMEWSLDLMEIKMVLHLNEAKTPFRRSRTKV